jgi:putative oxidoreductase
MNKKGQAVDDRLPATWEDMMEAAPRRSHLADLALLLGRLLLSLIFLHEGVSLALDITTTIDTFAALGLSAPVATAVIVLQIGAGLFVATGFLSRLGALALGIFCLATAFLFHTNLASQNELLHFEKDLAIAGGMFVLLASGAGSISVTRLIKSRAKIVPRWLEALT